MIIEQAFWVKRLTADRNGLMDDIYTKYHVDTIEEALKSFEKLKIKTNGSNRKNKRDISNS
jgi:hypothetical protein